jgi:hypothetical protein
MSMPPPPALPTTTLPAAAVPLLTNNCPVDPEKLPRSVLLPRLALARVTSSMPTPELWPIVRNPPDVNVEPIPWTLILPSPPSARCDELPTVTCPPSVIVTLPLPLRPTSIKSVVLKVAPAPTLRVPVPKPPIAAAPLRWRVPPSSVSVAVWAGTPPTFNPPVRV